MVRWCEWGECGSLFELDLGCTELTRQDMSEALPPLLQTVKLKQHITSCWTSATTWCSIHTVNSNRECLRPPPCASPSHPPHLHLTAHTTYNDTQSPHLTSHHLTTPHLTSASPPPHLTSPHLTSHPPHLHLTAHTTYNDTQSPHLTSHHLTTPHLTSHPPHLHLTSQTTYHDTPSLGYRTILFNMT